MDSSSIEVIVTGALIAGGGFLAWMTAIIVYVIRKETKLSGAGDPRKLLEMRYVKGEIDEDEYRRRLSVITYGPPLPADLPVPEEDLGLLPSKSDEP